MSELREFKVHAEGYEDILVTIETKDGKHFSFSVPLHDFAGMAQYAVRELNSAANARAGKPPKPNMKARADLTVAEGAEMHEDGSGKFVHLSINDRFGQTSWKLKPDLALSVGEGLRSHAQNLQRRGKT